MGLVEKLNKFFGTNFSVHDLVRNIRVSVLKMYRNTSRSKKSIPQNLFWRGSYCWDRDVNMGGRRARRSIRAQRRKEKASGQREWRVALKVAVRYAVELNLVQRGIQTTTGDTSIDNKSREFSFLRNKAPLHFFQNCKCDLILSVSNLHNGAMCSGC